MRRPVVVLDTNVAATGLTGFYHIPQAKEQSASVLCITAATREDIVLKTSTPLLAELERVLQYPWFGQPKKTARKYVRFLRRHAQLVRPPGRLRVLMRDPDDNVVLECAVVGKADYLVTWNVRDFAEAGVEREGRRIYRGVMIVPPPAFIQDLIASGWQP